MMSSIGLAVNRTCRADRANCERLFMPGKSCGMLALLWLCGAVTVVAAEPLALPDAGFVSQPPLSPAEAPFLIPMDQGEVGEPSFAAAKR
jgi:hypothetical protein